MEYEQIQNWRPQKKKQTNQLKNSFISSIIRLVLNILCLHTQLANTDSVHSLHTLLNEFLANLGHRDKPDERQLDDQMHNMNYQTDLYKSMFVLLYILLHASN